jgi:hypothetical protein
MSFFVVEPETSGRPVESLGTGGLPACSFDTWLGDDIVRAHPLLLVTTPLKDALLRLPRPTGFSVVRAQAIRSEFFLRHDPERQLPEFWSVELHGQPGVDDLGMGRDGRIVASARVVEALTRCSLKRATLSQHTPPRPEPGPVQTDPASIPA